MSNRKYFGFSGTSYVKTINNVLCMTEISARNVTQTGLDLIAAHFIADTIRPGEDKTRALYGGLTAAALYASSPWLKDRFNDLGNLSAEDFTKKDAAIIGGLAGLGALAGYFWKPSGHEEQASIRVPPAIANPERPHGFIFGASALYLAASIIDPTRSEEFKTRQRSALAGGIAAYTLGPEIVQKTTDFLAPDNDSAQTRRAIALGILGGTGGALIRYVPR